MAQEYPTRIQIEEGIEILLSYTQKRETEIIGTEWAYGRILAQEIKSEENIPPFDRSPYDGYALRSVDVASASHDRPAVLKIIEEVPAGHAPIRKVGPQEAVKILTGAPVPKGADAVVKYEDTSFDEKEVCFFSPVSSGSNIVKAGEDVKAGATVLHPGQVLDPAAVGLLAGMGYSSVSVYKKPLVKIISTGDELLDIDSELTPGKIRNSSAYMLKGFLEQWGLQAEIYGIVKDDGNAICKAICQCMEDADLVITTGGASAGDYDLVLEAMEKAGARILFWKVAMKPGMATLASVKEGKLLLGLSGNPSAAAAALFMLGLPVFRKMCGKEHWEVSRIQVCLPDGFPKGSPGGRILPGTLQFRNGQICINTQKHQANGMISPWSNCNVIGLIPKGSGPLEPGSIIEALYLENV